MTDVGRVAGRLCRYWFIRLPRTVCRTLMTSNSKWIVQVPKLISIIDADTLQEKIRARKTRRRSKQVLSQEPKMSVKGFVNVLEASWWVSKVQVSLTHLAFWQTPRTDRYHQSTADVRVMYQRPGGQQPTNHSLIQPAPGFTHFRSPFPPIFVHSTLSSPWPIRYPHVHMSKGSCCGRQCTSPVVCSFGIHGQLQPSRTLKTHGPCR